MGLRTASFIVIALSEIDIGDIEKYMELNKQFNIKTLFINHDSSVKSKIKGNRRILS